MHGRETDRQTAFSTIKCQVYRIRVSHMMRVSRGGKPVECFLDQFVVTYVEREGQCRRPTLHGDRRRLEIGSNVR